jgi:hypothetical protein
MQDVMTREERRERNRLRSERYRRAKGVLPRQPAQKPWLALGISRSTSYRRRKRAQEAQAAILRETAIARAASLADQLCADLARCAALNGEITAMLADSAARNGYFDKSLC